MSCWEKEKGYYVFSTAAWGKFKTAIRKAYDGEQTKKFQRACEIYEKLIEGGKGKRLHSYMDEFKKIVYKETTSYSFYNSRSQPTTVDLDPEETIRYLLFPEYTYKTGTKPKRPLKQNFPLATTKTLEIQAGPEGRIRFDDTSRTAHWDVSDNNHSVELARRSTMGRIFFTALAGVTWTRGTGGWIEYTSEMASEYDNSSSPRWSRNSGYGPRFEKEQEFERQRLGIRRPRAIPTVKTARR